MTRFNWAILSAITVAGCVGTIDETGDDTGSDGSGSDVEPVTCDQARTYLGFDGTPLEGDRPAIVAGSDRLRVKPFRALADEYNRALGITGFSTQQYASTFGAPPPRWFLEPAASANTIYAAFSLAYSACGQKTATGGDFAMAPSPTIADRLCRDFARAAWQREASDSEVAACTTYALDQTNPADAPAKRWAYTCAAVLSASGFLTY